MTDATLNRFIASGTTAERTAFTPSPPTPASGPDPGYFWWDTDLQELFSYDFGMADWVSTAGGGLGSIADDRIIANISGGAAVPTANTLTAIIDACIGSTQGNILYRNNTGWVVLAPGTAGHVLTTGGAAANPAWAAGGSGALTYLDEVVTASSAADVTFSSLGSHRDLILVGCARGDTSAAEIKLRMQFNADTGSNYDYQQHFGDSSTAAFDHAVGTTFLNIPQIAADTHTANYFSACEITIHRYRDTNKFKPYTAKGNEQTTGLQRTVSASGTWKSTSAITSIKLFCSAGNFKDNSVFTLFGRG